MDVEFVFCVIILPQVSFLTFMPKNTLQDVVPPERKSIRRIPLSITRTVDRQGPRENEEETPKTRKEPEKRERSRKTHYGIPKFGIWILVAVAVVIFLFATATFFTGATVTVTPRSQSVLIDVAGLARASGEGLVYKTVAVSGSSSMTIPSSGQIQVQKKSTGKIIVYNNYSAAPQKLIKNTRFESPSGLIYRIDSSVTVPGRRTESGKTVPGSVEATVLADLPGSSYNIGLTDFTIPGFKGDPRYSGFYARSKTPMAGGFSGMMPSADPKQLADTYNSIETAVTNSLKTKLGAAVPAGYVLFSSAVSTEFQKADPMQASGSSVTLVEFATSTAFVFDEKALSSYLADHALSTQVGTPVSVTNLSDMTFNSDLANGASSSGTLQFDIKGNAMFIWQFDPMKFQSDLAGRAKKDMGSILVNYPAIEKAEVVVRPFWRSSFPSSAEKIKILTKSPVAGR